MLRVQPPRQRMLLMGWTSHGGWTQPFWGMQTVTQPQSLYRSQGLRPTRQRARVLAPLPMMAPRAHSAGAPGSSRAAECSGAGLSPGADLRDTDPADEDSDLHSDAGIVWAKSAPGVWGLGHSVGGKLCFTRDIPEEQWMPEDLLAPLSAKPPAKKETTEACPHNTFNKSGGSMWFEQERTIVSIRFLCNPALTCGGSAARGRGLSLANRYPPPPPPGGGGGRGGVTWGWTGGGGYMGPHVEFWKIKGVTTARASGFPCVA